MMTLGNGEVVPRDREYSKLLNLLARYEVRFILR